MSTTCKPAGLLHVALVRSPYAHAVVRNVDVTAAASAPGVVKVYTGEDLKRIAQPTPGEGGGEGGVATDNPAIVRYALATDRVRHLGEAVVAVVADDIYAARDAADLVEVDYEELPAVTDVEQAVAEGAPLLFDHVANNVFVTWQQDARATSRPPSARPTSSSSSASSASASRRSRWRRAAR